MTLWNEDLVQVNKYSRPGLIGLTRKGIIIHWTANPGGSDTGHKTFFDGDDGGGSRYAGCHIFVDKDSAVLIIPLKEIAYHANEQACRIEKLKGSVLRSDGTVYYGNANVTTVGLELCVEEDGTIHPDTVKRSVLIVAELCKMYNLGVDDIYRHYDVTGKPCPAPWVTNSALFTKFKEDVKKEMLPPKNVRFITGWYNGFHAGKVIDFCNLNGRTWYYKPIRESNGFMTFKIEGFPKGSAGYLEMKRFLDDNKYGYTEEEI